GDKAFEAFENISSLEFEFFKDLAIGYVKSSISFIDRVSSHISRCPVLSWWDSLFSDFTAIHFSPKVVVKTYQKSLDWLENQVAPTFAMVLESLAAISPDDAISFFYRMWLKGTDNMSEKQKFLLRSWLASNGLIPCVSTS
ncbi:MAG: replication initiation factor domain-containing protein, partial [Bacteroidota bacterium]